MNLSESLIKFLPEGNSIRKNFEAGRLINQATGMSRKDLKSVLVKLVESNRDLSRKDILAWRSALEAALDFEKPRRADLIYIYHDAILDPHIFGAIRNRILQTLQRKFKVIDQNGEENVEATLALQKKWFRKFCHLALKAEFWGTTLIQFGDLIEGKFVEIKEVPRPHVVPEFGIVIVELGDDDGLSYRKGKLSEWVIEVGDPDNLGLLNRLIPDAISKRNLKAFWDEFAEVFGMPIRIAKTSVKDKKEASKIDSMLADMGSNAWGRFAQGTDIEILESKKGDAFQVYDKRIERANSEISKAILGQTMTMDDGSSKSQAEVHLNVADDIVEADGVDLSYVINDDLIPFLIKKGFTEFKEGDKFIWDDTKELSLKEQMEIDQWLLEHFEIEEDYFKEKYNSRIIGLKKVEPASPSTGGGGDEGK